MSDKFNNKFSPAKSGKARINTTSAEWVKNAIKSLGYSSMDILNDVMPSTIDAVKSVTELSQEVVDSVRDLKGQTTKIKNSLDKNVYMELGRNLKNYTLEDLKTGKFYNKERADSFDDDFDMDFDLGDPDDYDSSISSTSKDGSTSVTLNRTSKNKQDVDVVQVTTNINSDNPMVSAVKEQTRVSYEGANLVAEVSKRNQMMTLNQLNTMSSQIGSQLSSMSDNVGMIATLLGDTLSKHVGLSAQYYNDSMGAFNNIISELKIVSQQTKLATANTTDMSSYKEYKNVLDTVFTAGGFVNIKEYANLVRSQFNKVTDNNYVLSSVKGMVSQTDVLSEMVKNPLRFVSDSIVKKFIPAAVQTAAQKFDETFRETAIAGLYQIRNMGNSDNILKEIFGKTFGVGNSMKSSIDKSNYNKDAVAFDGITHRTINDVIPFYLRRLTALAEGSQEIAFDYEKGVFDTVKNITENSERERNRRKLGGLSSVASDFNEYLGSNFKFTDPKQATELNQTFNKLLTAMVDRDGGINFRRYKDKSGRTRDDIAEILDIRDAESSVLNIIRGFFQGSENSYNLRVFGREALEARAGFDKYMREIEANPLKFNANLLDNGTKFDTHIEYKKGSNDFTRKVGGMFGADVYGKDALYYLRETATMIASGIGVFILGGSSTDGGSTSTNPNASKVNEFKNQKQEYDNKNIDKSSQPLSEEKIKDIRKKGKYVVVNTKDLDSSLSINSKQAAELRRNQLAEEEGELESDKPTFLSRLASIKPESGFSKILTKFDNMTKATATKLEGYFTRANDALFKLVFGSDEDPSSKGGSFIQRAFEGLKLQFSVFGNWMDKTLLTPIYENLFGEDGVFTKLKDTQFAQDIKSAFKGLGEKLFGFDDGQGNKVGGLLSSVVNELKDGGRYALQFLTGKEYTDSKGQKHAATDQSVFGVFKNVASTMSESFRNYIGVEKFDPAKSKTGSRLLDGVDSIWTTVKIKTNEFIDDVLGTPDVSDTRREFSKFTKEMSEGMPKIAASSIAGLGIGLIPSLFIPGGPIGGAIIGAGMGIVSQSSKIKDFLFGPEVDGDRIGGLINKEVQDFFKDNKLGLGMGLGAGALASMGLIPSLFVPGGPIGGALIGGAISMANKSESLSKFLFGEDLDGNKIEGSISEKFENMTGITLKEGFVGAGMGAGVGLIGSFFLPGGPITGALLGSAAGLALSTDKFKTYLFGDKDPETGRRHGGMFGAMGDWTKEHLFNPMGKAIKEAQINVMGFIKKEMVAPLAVSMIPIKEEFKRFKERLFGGVKKFFDDFGDRLNTSFDKYFGQPIGEFLETKVLNPLKSVVSKIFGGIGKIFGSVVSSPFKLLNAVADGLYEKHQKEGIRDLKDRTVNTVFRRRDDKGNKISWGQRWDAVKEYVSPKGREAARYGEKGAWYRDQYEGRLAQYRAKIDDEMNRKKMDLDHAYQSGNINSTAYKAQLRKLEAQKKAIKNNIPKTEAIHSLPVDDSRVTDVKATVADSNNVTKSRVVANYMTEDAKRFKVSKGMKLTSLAKQSKVSSGEFDTESKAVSSDTDDLAMSSAKVANDKSRGISKAKRDSLLVRMDKNLQIIADSTKDQLDGVGKNVYRIRKMMQKQLGISDDDITGSANKDRKGFLGKLTDMFKNPVRGLKDLVLTPIHIIGSVGNYFKDKVVDTIDGVTAVIKFSIGGLFKFAKGLGKAALDLLSIPKTILQMGLEGLKMIGPAVAETLKSGVQIVGKSIMTGIDLIGTGIKAVGSTIVEGAKGLGTLIGGAMQGLGHLLVGAGVIAKDAAITITKGVVKATAFVGGTALNAAAGVTGWVVDKLFNRDTLNGRKSNRVQKVFVEGGFLDRVKSIGEDSPIKDKLVGSDTEKNSKIGSVDISKEYGENADGVVTGLRLHSQEQAAKVAEEAKLKEIEESRAAIVSGGSYESRTAEWAAAEKAESELSFKERLLSGITSIKNTTLAHANNWGSIFGKEGLITSALLLGVPFIAGAIKKLLDWFRGNGDGGSIPEMVGSFLDTTSQKDEAGRTGLDGQTYDSLVYESKWGRLGVKAGAAVYDAFTGKGGKLSQLAYDIFAKNPKKAAKVFATATGKEVFDESGELITRKLTEGGAKLTAKGINRKMQAEGLQSAISGAINKGKTSIINKSREYGLDMALINGKATVAEITSSVKNKVGDNAIVKKFIGLLDKSFSHVLDSDLVKKVLSSNAINSIKATLKKITSGLSEFIIKSGTRFLSKIGMAVAEDGSVLFPPVGGIVKLLFGTADFISGMTTDAGKIFQVGKGDVTFGMRVAAGISKVIVGLSAIVDVGNEIYRIWTDGQGLREFLAELIYDTALNIGGFLGNPEESKARYKQAQANFRSEYESYNEQLRAQGKEEMSFLGYMDKEHESLGSKFKRGVTNTWNDVKTGASNMWESTKTRVSNRWDALKTGTSNVWSNVKTGAKNIWNKGTEYLGGIKDSAIEYGKSIIEFNKVLFRPLVEFVQGKIDTLQKAVSQIWSTITNRVNEILTPIVGWIDKTWTNVKTTASNIKDSVLTKLGEFKDGVVDLWEGAKTKAVEIKDAVFDKMTQFKDKAVEVWDGVTTRVADFFEPAVEWVSNTFDKIKTGANNIWNSISNGIKNVTDSITNSIKGLINKVTGFFGNIWNNITGFFGDAWGNTTDFFSNIWGRVTGFVKDNTESSEYLTDLSDAAKNVIDKRNDLRDSILGRGDKGGEAFGRGSATAADVHQGFSYYSQSDPRWGKKKYLTGGKDRSMAYGGCGPTSLAMVISQLTGAPVDPYSVAQESSKRGMVTAGGTKWSAMTQLPALAGLTSQFIGTGDTSYRFNDSQYSDQVFDALRQNKPVILSGNRRKGVAKSDSPFTDGGHFVVAHGVSGDKVVINDPRSREASKLYEFDEVMKETKGAWKFPTNVRGSYSNGAGTSQDGPPTPESLGIIGSITGTIDAFLKPLKERLYGVEQEEDMFGSTNSSTSYDYNMSSGSARTIAEKTAELMRQNESSNNYAIAKNDTTGAGKLISPSIGVLQWREGNAKELMNRMYQRLPNDPDAKYFATQVDWSDRKPWTSAQLTRYRNFMTRNAGVSKEVQDAYSVEHIQNKILPNVYKYAVNNGKIKDPRSIVMLADISQTGPAHVAGFMTGKTASGSKYTWGRRPYNTTVPAGMSEFEHFNKEIRSSDTNYWGRHITTYKGRFDKSYNALKSWMPSEATDKGGETTCNYAMDKGGYDNRVAYNTTREVVKYNTNTSSDGQDVSILKEVVHVLKEILVESKGTNRGIDAFNKKKFPQQGGNNQIVIDRSINTNTQNKYGAVDKGSTKAPRPQQKSILNSPQYKLAKDIAMGINT